MQKEQKKLKNHLTEIFVSHGEMVEDNGEDWFIYSLNDRFCLLCVLDGCGGIGSRKYTEFENKSGAFIASHIASEAVHEWFCKFSESKKSISGNTIKGILDDLKKAVTDELKKYESDATANGIKGALVKSFPTTISLILFTIEANKVYSAFVWAGDSRGYVLTDKGLMQITVDDIETQADALDNLSGDSKLTNFITSSGSFVLNEKILKASMPSVLVTATDGCFGYFSTPMEFEYLLVDSLQAAKDVDDWQQKLNERIKKITGDDYTMGIAVVGYKNFRQLRMAFVKRKKDLFKKYISRLNVASESEKAKMWEEYKKYYYKEV